MNAYTQTGCLCGGASYDYRSCYRWIYWSWIFYPVIIGFVLLQQITKRCDGLVINGIGVTLNKATGVLKAGAFFAILIAVQITTLQVV
jgi:hypothetical protein